jgi:Ca2+-binding RTX toxin-like protein
MNGHDVVTATGLDISARALELAIETRSFRDDYQLFAQALSGADRIIGSAGDNELRGYAGADVMKGRGGFDALSGGQGNDNLSGGNGNDHLAGNQGNDMLAGDTGHDVLVGGIGNDTFVFNLAVGVQSDSRIADFTLGHDDFLLRPEGFTLPSTGGVLDDSAFHIGAHATTAAQRIIYDARNGDLLFDSDGAGGHAAVTIGSLEAHLHLTAADFLVA